MPSRPPSRVFFLSDYGMQDEFVGVVHAVILQGAPKATVVDLTHEVPAFDVRSGARTLVRAAPHLGPGVVLAVVDPGVGSRRRGLCLRVAAPRHGITYFVGPDNGLLVAAAEVVGETPIAQAFELHRPPEPEGRGGTFDGRDLFAPAAAALCTGTPPEALGDPVAPESLVRLTAGVAEHGRTHDGRTFLRVEVTWVDRFGNVQLAATYADAGAVGLPLDGTVAVCMLSADEQSAGHSRPTALVPDGTVLRCVQTFAELARGELGLFVDANGHLAIACGEASAAAWLNVGAGELVVLEW
jgi:S-adenosylmethionine hydrolase